MASGEVPPGRSASLPRRSLKGEDGSLRRREHEPDHGECLLHVNDLRSKAAAFDHRTEEVEARALKAVFCFIELEDVDDAVDEVSDVFDEGGDWTVDGEMMKHFCILLHLLTEWIIIITII